MFKKVFLVLLLLLLNFSYVKAQEYFRSSVNVEYKVQTDGTVSVTHTVSIRNITTENYSKGYLLNLYHLNPKNIKAYENGEPIQVDRFSDNGIHKLKLTFDKAVAGKDKTRVFVVTYVEDSLVKKSGDVWEISVPRQEIGVNTNNYKVVLSVPEEFGEEALISPEPNERKAQSGRKEYVFSGNNLEKSVITGAFGKFQVFSFDLTYHLSNDENEKVTQNIALPPDVSTQRVFYEEITPKPINAKADEDGNWYAYYDIPPKKQMDIKVKGYVQIFAKPLKVLTPYPDTLLENLKPKDYWQSDNLDIKSKASELKTPRAIYDFVVEKLNYNYERVTPEVERLGAIKALENPNDAICMEFTDLFIALTRAAGIPAREINGYAYSDNLNLQPLSLVADVLHSWPEYWNEQDQVWVPVDPTWEDTSEVDYFDKFDLRHFAFVIHGSDSRKPLPAGSYKSKDTNKKDVFINFSSIPDDLKIGKTSIDYRWIHTLNLFETKLVVKLNNDSATALYNIIPKISYGGQDEVTSSISQIIPYGFTEIEVKLPVGLFASEIPNTVSVQVQDDNVQITVDKGFYIVVQLLTLFLILITTIVFAGLKTKKISKQNIKNLALKFKK